MFPTANNCNVTGHLVPHLTCSSNKQATKATANSTTVPDDRLTAEEGIALMPVTKGTFNVRLRNFIDSLGRYRNEAR